MQNFFLRCKGATMWNSLPDDIKKIDSFNPYKFKRRVKLHIHNQPHNKE